MKEVTFTKDANGSIDGIHHSDFKKGETYKIPEELAKNFEDMKVIENIKDVEDDNNIVRPVNESEGVANNDPQKLHVQSVDEIAKDGVINPLNKNEAKVQRANELENAKVSHLNNRENNTNNNNDKLNNDLNDDDANKKSLEGAPFNKALNTEKGTWNKTENKDK